MRRQKTSAPPIVATPWFGLASPSQNAEQETPMSRFIAFLYGLVSYVIFFVTFLYALGFVEGLVVPKTIDSGATGSVTEALVANILLMSLFAIQHSVMARFKQSWTK
jgi:hypothetical protein